MRQADCAECICLLIKHDSYDIEVVTLQLLYVLLHSITPKTHHHHAPRPLPHEHHDEQPKVHLQGPQRVHLDDVVGRDLQGSLLAAVSQRVLRTVRDEPGASHPGARAAPLLCVQLEQDDRINIQVSVPHLRYAPVIERGGMPDLCCLLHHRGDRVLGARRDLEQ